MNPSQMMILESFAGARDEQELNDLMDVLRDFYAQRLEREMQRLWDNGTLDGGMGVDNSWTSQVQ